MTRAELMDAAIKKLNEVATLLTIAGEDRLAADAQELAEWVDFSSPTLARMSTLPIDSQQLDSMEIDRLCVGYPNAKL